jgi:predicted nucleic acid-binding protein
MGLVVDASVAALWFLGEDRSAAALQLVEERTDALLAPDLLAIEVGNALWNVRRRTAKPISLAPVLDHLAGLITYESSLRLLTAASAIARDLDHPVYDCLYLALVERDDSAMVTADRRLVRKLRNTPFEGKVTLLAARA